MTWSAYRTDGKNEAPPAAWPRAGPDQFVTVYRTLLSRIAVGP